MRSFALLLTAAGFLHAQQGTVQNAADRVPLSLPWFSSFTSSQAGPQPPQLARRSLAIINYLNSSPSNSSPPATASAATVSLRAAGSGTLLQAQVVATDLSTITFVIPADAPLGETQLIYQVAGFTNWIGIVIVPARFAFFRTADPGPPLAQQFTSTGLIPLNALSNPAQPGQSVVLWGSGLGATPASGIAVALGGVPQAIQFAGPSPNLPGIDQINFTIAQSTPQGCYVPLTLTYGTASATSFLSISPDGSVCRHPFQLSARDLKALDTGGAVALGSINISSGLSIATGDHAARLESAGISFSPLAGGQIAAALNPAPVVTACSLPVPPGSGVFSFLTSINPVFLRLNFGSMTLRNPAASLPLRPVGAGVLTALGTTTTFAAAIPAATDAPLGALPPATLPSGQWTWSGSGGDYPASSFTFAVPEPVRLVGSAPLTLIRTQDQTVTWNGGSFDSKSTLTLTLSGPTQTLLTCVAPGNAGSVVIPKALLAQLDPASATLTAKVSPSFAGSTSTTINLNDGTPLVMIAVPTSSDTRPADIQ